MNSTNIIESLAESVVLALSRDLPEIVYNFVPKVLRGKENRKDEYKKRRPYKHEIEVKHFSQWWGSTALGFKGMGGSAMTNAYTTVVILKGKKVAAVYFDGQFAYLVNFFDENVEKIFNDDLKNFNMPSQYKTERYSI